MFIEIVFMVFCLIGLTFYLRFCEGLFDDSLNSHPLMLYLSITSYLVGLSYFRYQNEVAIYFLLLVLLGCVSIGVGVKDYLENHKTKSHK